MSTIDPRTCGVDELYVVRTTKTGDREVYGMRLAPNGTVPWAVFAPGDMFHRDHEVEVICRADVQPQPWETLREAADRLEAAAGARQRAIIGEPEDEFSVTSWAYQQAVAAIEKHRTRADVAESELERVRTIAVEQNITTAECRDRAAKAEAVVDRVRALHREWGKASDAFSRWSQLGDALGEARA